MWKPVGKSLLGRPRRRREDNIKMNFRKWDEVHGQDLYGSGSGQVTCVCECSNEPPGSIKCGKFLGLLRLY